MSREEFREIEATELSGATSEGLKTPEAESTPSLWANSVFELRDAYQALRAAIGEHPDRETLVRRYEEIYAGFQRERSRRPRAGSIGGETVDERENQRHG